MPQPPSILDALDREWRQLSTGATFTRAVRAWSAREPALAGCSGAGDVIACCRRREDPAGANAAVGALLRLAEGDQLATRVLLQALLPGLRARLGRVRRRGEPDRRPLPGWGDLEELAADLVATTVERIHDLAGTSPTWPASAVVDGAWRRIRHRAAVARRAEAGVVPLWDDAVAAPPPVSVAEQLGREVIRAAAAGRLGPGAATTVYATRVLGYSVAEVAAASGRDPRAVRVQRARAERALVARAS